MGRRGRISAHVAGNTLRPGLRSAAQRYVTGRSVFPAPVMGGFGRVWSGDEPQETTAGRHVRHGEITGYTTGSRGNCDWANCIDRFDAPVGTSEAVWSPLGRQGPA